MKVFEDPTMAMERRRCKWRADINGRKEDKRGEHLGNSFQNEKRMLTFS